MTGRGFGRRVHAFVIALVLLLSMVLQPIALTAQDTRVIVQGTTAGSAAEAVLAVGGSIESDVPMIDSVIAYIAGDRLDVLRADARVVRVTADRVVELADTKDYCRVETDGVDVEFATPAGIEEVWAEGTLGRGVTVAIVDTGVDPRFSELQTTTGRWGQQRFLAYYDAISNRLYKHPHLLKSPGDPNGHGTHVAGIIANNTYERNDAQYRGVAPAANIVAIRVLNKDGVGSYADVLRGIQWAVTNRDRYNIRVMNISMFAIPVAPYWADPYNLAVMAAWEAGITVVASVGNTGPSPMSVGVPGNTPYVITVGAFTDHRTPDDLGDDYIPEFSAIGPTLDAFVKPDVIAPGAHIVSLMRPNAVLRRANGDSKVNGRYFEMSGSSMATAVVSGIAALVLSENGDLTPDQVKYRITQTAIPQLAEVDGQPTAAYSIWQQGAGRVWADDAVLSDIEGSANQGMNVSDDLAGLQHYQGWTTYEAESGTFQIVGGGLDTLIEGYTTWNGSFDSWADGYQSWADGETNWSGSFDSWADSFDSWADSSDSWADSFDSWADSFDSWADSYGDWMSACLPDTSSFDSWADTMEWSAFLDQLNSFGSWDEFAAWAYGVDPSTDVMSWAESFDSWADFVAWAESFDSWADYALWADSFDSWADSFDSWADSFDSWADSFDSWADAVAFADSFDSWADSFDSWADSFDSWADGETLCDAWLGSFDSWADSYEGWVTGVATMSDGLTTWTGAFSTWEGGYLTWANSFDSWADSFDSWADGYGYWVSVCSADSASFDSWADSFDSWADSFDSWADSSDNYADSFDSWADSFDSWADSFDSWADSTGGEIRPVFCGAWSGSFDSWADSFDSWADSFDSWADGNPEWDGGYTAWAGGPEAWATYDGIGGWAEQFEDPEWATNFRSTTQSITSTPEVSINRWVDPD